MGTKKIYKKGITLVETIIYSTFLAILSIAAVTSLLLLNQSLQSIVLGRIVDDAAQEIMEKIIREVRYADSIDVAQSTLSTNPSVLVLDSTDSGGSPVEVQFSITSGVLELRRDGALVGPLTPNQVTISELVFDRITTTESEAVKISLVLEAQRGASVIEETFNTTAVLRGSY